MHPGGVFIVYKNQTSDYFLHEDLKILGDGLGVFEPKNQKIADPIKLVVKPNDHALIILKKTMI